jgi:RNA polymerase sigma-70 factor (ECF subfamily)
MPLPNEPNLLEQLRKGNQKPFSLIYDCYASALYGVICRNIEHKSEAEKMLREVFVQFRIRITDMPQTREPIFVSLYKITQQLLKVKPTTRLIEESSTVFSCA